MARLREGEHQLRQRQVYWVLPTTLEMLRMLRGVTPFVIMTATFSSSMLARLGELLGAVVPGDEAEREAMERLGTQVGKMRRFHALDEPLTAEAVLESEYQGQRVICICNTLGAAQRLYVALRERLAQRGNEDEETVPSYVRTRLCLLHSRFYKGDRDEKERWVREQFGIAQAEYAGSRLIDVM